MLSSGITLNFNENNKLSFAPKKNFKTESTELYDISYQYMIDCLTAGLVYRREFYEDSDLEPKDTLIFYYNFCSIWWSKYTCYKSVIKIKKIFIIIFIFFFFLKSKAVIKDKIIC